MTAGMQSTYGRDKPFSSDSGTPHRSGREPEPDYWRPMDLVSGRKHTSLHFHMLFKRWVIRNGVGESASEPERFFTRRKTISQNVWIETVSQMILQRWAEIFYVVISKKHQRLVKAGTKSIANNGLTSLRRIKDFPKIALLWTTDARTSHCFVLYCTAVCPALYCLI